MAITNFGPGTFVWTDGTPVHDPNDGAKFAIDINTYVQYEWVSGTTWIESPVQIKRLSGTAAPSGAPGLHDSVLAVNEKTPNPEIYYYFSGSWHLVGGGGGGTTYTAGTGIDITGTVISNTGLLTGTTFAGDVSGAYNNLQLGAGVVGTNEIATDAVTAAKIAAGAVGSSELASTSVTPGSYTNTNLTVDADGRITAASNGSGLTWPLLAPDGSITQPSYAFDSSPESGMHFDGTSLVVSSGSAVPLVVGTASTLNTTRNAEFSTGDGPDGSGAMAINTGDAEGGVSGALAISTGIGKNESGAIAVSTGASSTGNTGAVSITTGISTDFAAGAFSITTGAGGTGGNIDITGGNSTAGDGSHVYIFSGNGTTTGGEFKLAAGGGETGGLFNLQAGDGTDADGGGFIMEAGSSTNGAGGGFSASAGDGYSPGTFTMTAGESYGDGITGGYFYINGGNATGLETQGGFVNITGGSALDADSNGGPVTIIGGNGGNNGGTIFLNPGNGGSAPKNGIIWMTGNGVKFPELTTTQRNALTFVGTGTTIYCSNETANDGSTGVVQTYNGSVWKKHW